MQLYALLVKNTKGVIVPYQPWRDTNNVLRRTILFKTVQHDVVKKPAIQSVFADFYSGIIIIPTFRKLLAFCEEISVRGVRRDCDSHRRRSL